ncbi:MAG: zinc-ribbon domain-containing protein [Planctomycetota bacterium]
MIIWGWRNVTVTKAKGRFACPHCASEEAYDHKVVRRCFTLYFIPVMPLNAVGDFVQCRSCRGQFAVDALPADAPARQGRARARYTHAAVELVIQGAVRADRPPPPRSVQEALERAYRIELTVGEVLDRFDQRREPAAIVAPVAVGLDAGSRENLFRAAMLGVRLGGDTRAGRQFLADLALALDMAPAHVHAILSESAAS